MGTLTLSLVDLGAGPIGQSTWPNPAWAQEPPTFELPEIVVPGKRRQSSVTTPASVSVLTREELERFGIRTVADALRFLPEVTVRSYGGLGNLAEPSIRGSSPGQVLVLLDGVPLNNVALGQTDLSTISIDGVERIEVLRGPFGAIHGSGSLGGVINIVTGRSGPAQVLVRAGGFGERSLHVAAGGSGGTPWQISLTSDRAQGHRPNSDYAGFTLLGTVPLTSSARVLIHHYRADLGTPGDVASPTPSDRQSERRTIFQVEASQRDTAGVTGRAYFIADDLTFASSFGSSAYASMVLGGEVQRVWQIGPGRLAIAGAELQQQSLNATIFGATLVRDSTIGSAYLQYDAASSARLLSSLGLRLDAHSVYGATVNPRAGLVYRLDDDTRVRFAVGRTFRGPTFLHLFFPGCSDPNLRSEMAWAAEMGLERQVGGTIIGVTVFGAEATDLISGGCPPQNIGSASIRGLSAEVRGQFGSGTTGFANVTLLSASDRTTGIALLRVPEITFNAAVHFQVSPSSLLTVMAEYVGARQDVDFSTVPATTVRMPPYADVRLRYQITTPPGWIVTVGVDNLLDQSYEVVKGFPAPGRSIFIAATKRF